MTLRTGVAASRHGNPYNDDPARSGFSTSEARDNKVRVDATAPVKTDRSMGMPSVRYHGDGCGKLSSFHGHSGTNPATAVTSYSFRHVKIVTT